MTAQRGLNPKNVPSTGADEATSAPPLKKNHVYLVGKAGHIYAYSHYPRSRLAPVQAMLQVAVNGVPIEMIVDGARYRTTAHFARPNWMEIDSKDEPVVAFMFNTYGAFFRSIRSMPEPITALPRSLFAKYEVALRAAACGTLEIGRAKTLFAEVQSEVVSLLPALERADERIERVLSMVREDIDLPVELLAKAVSLSPDRLSHLFTYNVGVSLRRIRLALKLERSIAIYRPGMSVNELAKLSGFTDVAHFSRSTKEIYGAPPTYFHQNTEIHY